MIEIVIPGQPVPKARPRVLKSGITYTPKRTAEYERLTRLIYSAKYKRPLDGSVRMDIRAYFAIPKSYPQNKRAALEGTHYPKRPDPDNIAKIIMDALNGLAYEDDSKVVELSIEKRYSENPRVEVRIDNAEAEE